MSTNESSTPAPPCSNNLPPVLTTPKDDVHTPASAASSANKGRKKRKMHWRQRKEQRKRDRVEKQDAQTDNNNNNNNKPTHNRRGPDQDWELQTPHEGSFAHPNARALFHVDLPEMQVQVSNDDQDDSAKLPKRKVALMLAYSGTNYGGLQMNVGERSLHAELELAFFKARLLSKTNFGFPHKYSWSTSARTDKGVHACAQVVSAKLAISDNLEQTRQLINQYLPDDIRILDIVKTTRTFCAKTQRDRARYTYMIPSFLLYDRQELEDLFTTVLGRDPRHGRSPRDPLSREETTKLKAALTKYRATPQQMHVLKDALAKYQGTLSFHNFTSGKTSEDANATRYIISFTAQDPIMMEGIEWIPTQVVGQSFLLHQIRKMVSLAIDVTRGSATMATVQHALSPGSKCQLNKAPAQGLFLDMSIFEGYNRRKANETLQHLDWVTDESTPAVQRWKDFRENTLMKHIGKEEAMQGNFIKYLYVQEYVYDYKNKYRVDKH